MSTLQQAAHAALTSFCRNATSLRTDDSNDVDIYRTLRDVSTLLYETQLVRDMFDSDPFGLTWRMNDDDEEAKDENDEDDYEDKNKDISDDAYNEKEKNKTNNLISQIQNMLQVTSCHRTATPHGYSSISAIVQFNINNDHDDHDRIMMENKDDGQNNIRLRFTFVREPMTTASQQQQRIQYSALDDTAMADGEEDEDAEEDTDDDEEAEDEVSLSNKTTPEQKQQQQQQQQQQQNSFPARKKRKITNYDEDVDE